jgi:hypothetical protein
MHNVSFAKLVTAFEKHVDKVGDSARSGLTQFHESAGAGEQRVRGVAWYGHGGTNTLKQEYIRQEYD